MVMEFTGQAPRGAQAEASLHRPGPQEIGGSRTIFPTNSAAMVARSMLWHVCRRYLLSLRPCLFTARREKAFQGLSTRKHQGNPLQHPSRRRPRLPERYRRRTNRLVLLCRSPRLLKHLRPPLNWATIAPQSRCYRLISMAVTQRATPSPPSNHGGSA